MPKSGTIERQHWWWAGSCPYSISNLHLSLGCPAWAPQNQYLIFFGSLRKLSTSSRKHHKKLFAARRKETKHFALINCLFSIADLHCFCNVCMYICMYCASDTLTVNSWMLFSATWGFNSFPDELLAPIPTKPTIRLWSTRSDFYVPPWPVAKFG